MEMQLPKRIKKEHAAGIVALALFLFCVMPVSAQVPDDAGIPRGVQISPIRFEMELHPGETWNGSLNIKNFAAESKTVTLSAENFVVSDNTENISFYQANRAEHLAVPDVADWVMLPQQTITLAPGEAQNIGFGVHVPDTAPTGGYYGALFVALPSALAENDNDQSRLRVDSRMGALLVIAVQGSAPVRIEGAIEYFAPLARVFFWEPATVRTVIANAGNLHFRGDGVLTISRLGRTKAEIPLASQVNYPQKKRTYDTQWNFGPLDIGPYTASVRYTSLSTLVQLEATTTIWVFPWMTIVVVGGVLIILWRGIRYIRTHYDIRRR